MRGVANTGQAKIAGVDVEISVAEGAVRDIKMEDAARIAAICCAIIEIIGRGRVYDTEVRGAALIGRAWVAVRALWVGGAL